MHFYLQYDKPEKEDKMLILGIPEQVCPVNP